MWNAAPLFLSLSPCHGDELNKNNLLFSGFKNLRHFGMGIFIIALITVGETSVVELFATERNRILIPPSTEISNKSENFSGSVKLVQSPIIERI